MSVVGVTTGNMSAILAQEILVELIGLELAQRVNTPETVWVKYLEGLESATAHYRWENPFSTATLATAIEGNNTGLPVGSYAPSEQTISTAFEGQSIPVGVQVLSLAPVIMSSISRQTSSVLERAIDSGVCSVFPSLTTTSVGSSGAALTVSNILTANANLDAVHANEVSAYNGRLHPHQFNNLYQDIMSKNFGIAKIEVDALDPTRQTINIGGTILKTNTFVPTVNSGANYNGGIYANQAIGLVVGMGPQVYVNYGPGTGQMFVDGFISIGVGVLRSTLGCPVISGVSA